MMTWRPDSIKNVLNGIEDNDYPKYVLPVMQRFFVWKDKQVENLFSSLLKGNSFGAIIVIDEDKGKEPMFASRKFVLRFTEDQNPSSDDEEKELKNYRAFVVDGQQRLQSFYIGLKGTLESKKLYFNLLSNYKDKEFNFKFFSQEDKDINSNTEKVWYEVQKIYEWINIDEDDTTEKIIKEKNIDIKNKEIIRKNLSIFSKSVQSDVLGISRVNVEGDDIEKNRAFALDMFISINSAGTRLSSYDLMSSKFKTLDPRMEGFLKEIGRKYEHIGLGQNELIKLIFILQDSKSEKIEKKDALFAIDNQNKIDNILDKLEKFLSNKELFDYYAKRKHSFIPFYLILYYFYNMDDNKLNNIFTNFDKCTELNSIKKWLTHSLLNSVFKSTGSGWRANTTGLNSCLDILKRNKNKEFPIDELFNLYKKLHFFKTDYELNDLDKLDRNFLFFMMYGKNYKIIKEGRTNDVDHIIPKSKLKDKYEADIINSVKNYQLLDDKSNRGNKNDKSFYEWFSKFVEDKDSFLEIHLIPKNEELWHEDRYKDFIEERGKIILERINTALK